MADRIAVLTDGRVTELGDHTELMSLGGRYARMFTLQANGSTRAPTTRGWAMTSSIDGAIDARHRRQGRRRPAGSARPAGPRLDVAPVQTGLQPRAEAAGLRRDRHDPVGRPGRAPRPVAETAGRRGDLAPSGQVAWAAVGMALSVALTWVMLTVSGRMTRRFRDKVTIAWRHTSRACRPRSAPSRTTSAPTTSTGWRSCATRSSCSTTCTWPCSRR